MVSGGNISSSSDAPRFDYSVLTDSLRKRLHPLIVCLSHSWGGLEQVAANDSLDIAAQGIPVRVLCLEGTPMHENLAKRKEVITVPLNFRPRDFFDFKLRNELYRQFKEGVNLIHSHQTSLLGSIVPWIWNKAGISAFASRHIMNNHNKRNFFHAAVYSRLDALIVMSNTLRKNVLETHPLREKQIKVVKLGLDFDRFDSSKVNPSMQRARWNVDKNTVVIGLVGRIDPAKGQSTFIKAAAGLMKTRRVGEKIKFVMVGEETLGRASQHLEELKRIVVQFHLEDLFIFDGYKENIPEVMKAFDIFVMPSRQEAFGLVAIEAMSMECPVIISSGGSAAEIVGDEEFGLLVHPEDAFDLQRQLRYLLDNPIERVKMGKRAREHVVRNYDKKVRLYRSLELYDKTLRRRGVS